MVYGHDVFQGVFEPLEMVDFMFLADSKEGIDHGCALCGLVASGKEVVFPSEVMQSFT